MTRDAADEFVTVAAYVNEWQARLAQAALEAEGLETMLVGQHHASLNWLIAPALGGIRLRVRQTDAERAQEILNDNIQD